jgi:coenzyme F420 hydrogenase subunit beta
MSDNKGLQALEEQVLGKDLCTLCGACASLCPYLRPVQGKIAKMHDCNLVEGRCFDYCPRTEVDMDRLHKKVFGQGYQDIELGPMKRILMARATDSGVRAKAQTGGAVSALMSFALREGIIDAAVLTQRDSSHLPAGFVAGRPEEILNSAGSSYVAGPTLEALNKGPLEGKKKIGLVGVPCQVLALGKMKDSNLETRTPIDRVALIIGLFCTWALAYRPFLAHLRERLDGAEITKLDITPPPERLLKVYTETTTADIPIDDIRSFIRPTCGVCMDMTSELSDLSVGTVEGVDGWNTVVVRTDRGEDLFKRALDAGIIESQPLPEENTQHLKTASVLKKQRALKALKERGETENGYLILSSEIIQRILSYPTEEGS